MRFVQQSWKAVMALFVTALITFLTSTGGGLSSGEALRSATLSFLAATLVWLTPYKTGDLAEPGFVKTPRKQVGQSVVGLILSILGAVFLLLGAYDVVTSMVNNVQPHLLTDIILIVIGLLLVGYRYYPHDRYRL